MLLTASGFVLLVALALAVLPVPRVPRWLLTALMRLVQTTVLAFLGACGTFFVDPYVAPPWLVQTISPMLEGTIGLPADATSGIPWLVLAVMAVGVSLPLLMLVELGLNVSAQTSQVQSLRRDLRQAAAWVDARLAAVGIARHAAPAWPSEVAAAAEVLR